MPDDLPPELKRLIDSITAKRPKTVIDHIVKFGFVTTEELKNVYGYDHPPRAVRDVREQGIPLITFRVRSETTGRLIGAYKFDDPSNIKSGRIGGRRAFSKSFKQALVDKLGSRSSLTGEKLDARYLQIDHRIPYEIAGDGNLDDLDGFMLLDASSQRAKSWSCETCENFATFKDPEICSRCFWAFPERYQHIAMVEERHLLVVWRGEEIESYEQLVKRAAELGLSIQEYVKELLGRS